MHICEFDDLNVPLAPNWATPSRLRPLFFGDPAVVWLEHHGATYGFSPQPSAYSLMSMLERVGKQFEQAWMQNMLPADIITICHEPSDARDLGYVKATLAAMREAVPIIAQPALRYPAAQIYGVPDLMIRRDWLIQRFPELATVLSANDDHYVIVDLKYTTKLHEKKDDLAFYAIQVRLYSYMLGQIQGIMPSVAFLFTRDQIDQPIPIPIQSQCGCALDDDLAELCQCYRQIVDDGASLQPWRDAQVAPDYSGTDEFWDNAKRSMLERVEGGALERLWYVGKTAKQLLNDAGVYNLEQLNAADRNNLPKSAFRRRKQMEAILAANASKTARRAPPLPVAPYEFFVDCEFFSNINADFVNDWPALSGTPMLFMIGVGWFEHDAWQYRDFIATAETHTAERMMLDELITFLQTQTNHQLEQAKLYHWSHAEATQTKAAAQRHGFADDHPLLRLPWFDLEKYIVDQGAAIPGAWKYGLKHFVSALSKYDPAFAHYWPELLNDGSAAQVMGWHAYRCPDPLHCAEMHILRQYLEADCGAVATVLKWLRY